MDNEAILTGGATPPAEGEQKPAEGEQKPAEGEQKPAEGEKGFVLPEGVELADDEITAIQGLFTDAGLSVDQQQQIVDFMAEQGESAQTEQTEAYDHMMQDWQEQTRNDSEFGGDAFEQNLGIASGAIDKLGTPELKALLNEHGVGNHPEMFRFMWNVGKLLKEDNPGAGGHQSNKPQSDVDILYPNEK